MTYIQGKNPLSRKNSPLNANNPFKRVSPLNEVMLDPADDAPISPQNAELLAQMDTTEGGTMPQDTGIEPGDKDYEAISRKSSPLNEHDENKIAELTSKIDARAKELTGGDPQSRVDPFEDEQIKQWIAARTAEKAKHKEEKPKEEE